MSFVNVAMRLKMLESSGQGKPGAERNVRKILLKLQGISFIKEKSRFQS